MQSPTADDVYLLEMGPSKTLKAYTVLWHKSCHRMTAHTTQLDLWTVKIILKMFSHCTIPHVTYAHQSPQSENVGKQAVLSLQIYFLKLQNNTINQKYIHVQTCFQLVPISSLRMCLCFSVNIFRIKYNRVEQKSAIKMISYNHPQERSQHHSVPKYQASAFYRK